MVFCRDWEWSAGGSHTELCLFLYSFYQTSTITERYWILSRMPKLWIFGNKMYFIFSSSYYMLPFLAYYIFIYCIYCDLREIWELKFKLVRGKNRYFEPMLQWVFSYAIWHIHLWNVELLKSKRIDFLVSNSISVIEIHHLLHFWSSKSLYLYMPFNNFQGQYTLLHIEHMESYKTGAIDLENLYSALGLRCSDRVAGSHVFSCTRYTIVSGEQHLFLKGLVAGWR